MIDLLNSFWMIKSVYSDNPGLLLKIKWIILCLLLMLENMCVVTLKGSQTGLDIMY